MTVTKSTKRLMAGDRVVNDRYRKVPVKSVVQDVESRGRDFPNTSTVYFLNEPMGITVGDDELWELATQETPQERMDRLVTSATTGCPEQGDAEELAREVIRLRVVLSGMHTLADELLRPWAMGHPVHPGYAGICATYQRADDVAEWNKRHKMLREETS